MTIVGQRLFVLCGLPFSGKSTLARAMERRLDIVNVEVDRVHEERGLILKGATLTREDWIAAYRAAFKRLDEALRDGKSAVFDATSYRKLQRQRLRRIAELHGAATSVIYLDVPVTEVRRRLDANRRHPIRATVPSEDFVTVAREFQPPGEDESVFRYDATMPVEKWIELNLVPALSTPVMA